MQQSALANRLPFYYGWVVAGVAFCVAFLSFGTMTYIRGIYLPLYAEAFAVGRLEHRKNNRQKPGDLKVWRRRSSVGGSLGGLVMRCLRGEKRERSRVPGAVFRDTVAGKSQAMF